MDEERETIRLQYGHLIKFLSLCDQIVPTLLWEQRRKVESMPLDIILEMMYSRYAIKTNPHLSSDIVRERINNMTLPSDATTKYAYDTFGALSILFDDNNQDLIEFYRTVAKIMKPDWNIPDLMNDILIPTEELNTSSITRKVAQLMNITVQNEPRKGMELWKSMIPDGALRNATLFCVCTIIDLFTKTPSVWNKTDNKITFNKRISKGIGKDYKVDYQLGFTVTNIFDYIDDENQTERTLQPLLKLISSFPYKNNCEKLAKDPMAKMNRACYRDVIRNLLKAQNKNLNEVCPDVRKMQSELSTKQVPSEIDEQNVLDTFCSVVLETNLTKPDLFSVTNANIIRVTVTSLLSSFIELDVYVAAHRALQYSKDSSCTNDSNEWPAHLHIVG